VKVRTLVRLNTVDGWRGPGHIIDHPDAWKLVRRGLAEAVDEDDEAVDEDSIPLRKV
jgi:hypothetical protein